MMAEICMIQGTCSMQESSTILSGDSVTAGEMCFLKLLQLNAEKKISGVIRIWMTDILF